jgi:Mitochondrial carrier protein
MAPLHQLTCCRNNCTSDCHYHHSCHRIFSLPTSQVCHRWCHKQNHRRFASGSCQYPRNISKSEHYPLLRYSWGYLWCCNNYLHLYVSKCRSKSDANLFEGPVEVAKNATQTSVLMAGLSNSDHRGPSISSVVPRKGAGRVSSTAATREIFRRYGFFGLYTGFKLHLARDVVGSAIYFGVYEATKQAMTSLSHTEKANTPLAVATAGMLCGMCSWGLVSSASLPRTAMPPLRTLQDTLSKFKT